MRTLPSPAHSLTALAFLVVGGLFAWAQSQGPAPEIPYQGRLEMSGAKVNGDHELVFRFFDDAAAGAQLGPDMPRTVNVVGGAFATSLGPVPNQAFEGSPLFLEIEVEGTVLAGRQRIRPATFAYGTSERAPFRASGYLAVAGGNTDATGVSAAQANIPGEAALTLGRGDNDANVTDGELDPDSVVRVPLGDEAAGGIVLYDKQSNDEDDDDFSQVAKVVYDSASNDLSVTSDGLGLHVQQDGDVRFDGRPLVSCPSDMKRIMNACIDATKSSGSWGEAVEDCHGQGKEVCDTRMLLACDHMQITEADHTAAVAAYGDCARSTDDVPDGTGDVHHTGLPSMDDFSASVYSAQGMACFNGADNSMDRCDDSDSHTYYCCVRGMRD